MGEIQVVPYRPEHLERLNAKSCHQGEIPQTVMTYALTLLLGDTVIAILGGFRFTPKIIHIWGLIGEEVKQCPVAFHKTCRKILSFYEMRDTPRRMQMDVRVDYLEGQAWAESLGFQREGVMRKYGPDSSDYYLYARVC